MKNMAILVEIDERSGFCGGVFRAVAKVEEILDAGGELYSLGEIVHNDGACAAARQGTQNTQTERVERLLRQDSPHPRARRTPETYSQAQEMGVRLIDCTCPVVSPSPKSIQEAYIRMKEVGGQVIIFGRSVIRKSSACWDRSAAIP